MDEHSERSLELTYNTWRYGVLAVIGLMFFGLGFWLGFLKFYQGLAETPQSVSYDLNYWAKAAFQMFGGAIGSFLAIRWLTVARRGLSVTISPHYIRLSHLNNGQPIPWRFISGVAINDREILFEAKGLNSNFPHDRSVKLHAYEASPETIERLFLSYWQQGRARSASE
ncbi:MULTISPECIES: hypothetical protein [unclassified Bosea (in: a-proteobacteria)]|uniref:hypothetical protein n=1 Tax=unclassified Bosea (in: a-proteobacteria) TaxID=2653178 RepID=UPI000F7EC2CD|nr:MULTISPECIES: hypothetical protein [unclassified Bosea (in: a-proteobacteria)]